MSFFPSFFLFIILSISGFFPLTTAIKNSKKRNTNRGYVPTLTRSMHCLRERSLDAAVAQFLRSEAREVEYVLEAMSAQMSPYKR